ncbi:MAG: nitroreductase family protein [Christensenellales bacterium]
MPRDAQYDKLPLITTRFSARALAGKPVERDTLMALVEAASFAPSCFNEQPWRFLIAEGGRFSELKACLTPRNQSWAGEAAALILLLSKKTFTQNGKDNAWHLSDAGTASGFLFLEAERRGLYAHPMAGFDKGKAREAFQIPEDLDLIEVIAVGWPSEVALLPEELQQQDAPKPRMKAEMFLL